jgi:hypothetical protein
MSRPDPHPDDELVSAYLDGEVDDDERQRVESDPELRRRAEELGAAARAVAAPVAPLDEVTSRRLIDTAVAAASDPAPPAPDVVGPPARRHRRPLAWAGAAAAVVVGLVLVGVLPDDGDGDDVALTERSDDVATFEADREATAGDAAAEAAPGGDAGSGGAPEAEESAGPGSDSGADESAPSAAELEDADGADGAGPVPAAGTDLGALPDLDALVAAARRAAGSTATAPTGGPCPAPSRPDRLTLEARATVAGVEYLVRVWTDAPGDDEVEVLAIDGCRTVLADETD